MTGTNARAVHVHPGGQPGLLRYLRAALKRLPSDRGERIDEYEAFPDWQGKNRRQELIEIPLMVKSIGLPPGGRVLEVGCGRGFGLVGLGRLLQPQRLVGLDIDNDFLHDARRRLDEAGVEAELFRGDVRRMPFPDESFDLVVDFGTCFHIAHPRRALGEIARVLANDGLFVHETMMGQFFSHPFRSLGRAMPTEWFPQLRRHRWRGLWTSRQKNRDRLAS